ncbi:sulfuric ester hydrolase [Aureococcus anophagefferens]|nr:sulfuric ester hydrolase [Aureococcus anophagefferens]
MDGRVVDPTSPVSSRVALPFLESLAKEGINFARTYTPAPHAAPTHGNGIAAEPSGAVDATCASLYDEKTCGAWAADQKHNGSLFDGVAAVAPAYDLAVIGKIDMGANAMQRHGNTPNVTWGTGFHSGPSLPIVTRAADVRKPTKPNPMAITSGDNDHTNATWLKAVNWTGAGKGDWIDVDDMHPYDAYESSSKAVAGRFSDDDVAKVQRTYYAMCAEADFLLGRVGDVAKARGFWDDALVVFTSDHGEMNMEHRQVWKNSMYEASARVPLILGGGAAGLKRAFSGYEPSTRAKRQNKATYLRFFAGARLADRLGDHAACLAAASEARTTSALPLLRGNATTLRDLFDGAYRGFDDADWAKVQAWVAEDVPGAIL